MTYPQYLLMTYVCVFTITNICATDMYLNFKGKNILNNFRSISSSRYVGYWYEDTESYSQIKKSVHSNNLWKNVGKFSLDLSGRILCNISAPYAEGIGKILNAKVCEKKCDSLNSHAISVPIFYWGCKNSKFPSPSIFLGADYNFSKVWFGVTRIFMRFSWNHKHNLCGKDRNLKKMNSHNLCSNTNQIPFYSINLDVNKGMLIEKDYSAKFSIAFPLNRRLDVMDYHCKLNNSRLLNDFVNGHSIPYFSIYLDSIPNDSHKYTTFCLTTPIYKRVRFVSKSTFLPKIPSCLSKHLIENYISKISSEANWSEVTWVPQISLAGDGTLNCRSQLGFRNPSVRSHDSNLDNNYLTDNDRYSNYGLRITAKKKFRWDMLSKCSIEDGHDNDTHIRFEFCGLGNEGKSYNSIRIDCLLKRVVASSKITILHQRFTSNNRNLRI